ncbi:FBD-associated F-box protein At2g26860-like [Abrus precatorius]|uniref:FBD-associated F-box protein At2g26860-like n=1 Tax=Abrus precatorius TaxID=3816 RepID=A0A8B8MJ44_ABRPR|nr:FBD-associated F-box protein At2g26860-like [Abrus precatorius]
MATMREAAGVDMISQLPDEVLCHILSFLQSKESIATCLLSKRWRFLWTMVPTFDFVCSSSIPPTFGLVCSSSIVKTKPQDKFLSLRKTQRITRFRLKCKNHRCCSPLIQKWISSAVDGKVEHLNISLAPEQVVFTLSCNPLFTCTTIVTMKLKGYFRLSVPSDINLPSLRNLHLDVVKCYPNFKKIILSGSPILKEFYLKEIRHPYEMSDSRYELWKIVRNPRGTLLARKNACIDLVIQSDYDFIKDYFENHWENIVKANVHMTVPDIRCHCFYPCAVSFLYRLRCVESLSLRDFTEWTMDSSTPQVPQFPNLVHLQLHLRHPSSLFSKINPKLCPKLQQVEVKLDSEDERY